MNQLPHAPEHVAILLKGFNGIYCQYSIALPHLLFSALILQLISLVPDGLGLASFKVFLPKRDIGRLGPLFHPANTYKLLIKSNQHIGSFLWISMNSWDSWYRKTIASFWAGVRAQKFWIFGDEANVEDVVGVLVFVERGYGGGGFVEDGNVCWSIEGVFGEEVVLHVWALNYL